MTDWRITLHWTAGTNTVSATDLEHYHWVIGADAVPVPGTHTPEDNLDVADGDYAAHVLNCNTANIGISLAGMRGAVESPLSVGDSPITEAQFEAAVKKIAELAIKYGVPATKTRILTHAEIQPNLMIQQRGKWDLTVLPWDNGIVGHEAVGDYLRARVSAVMGSAAPVAATGTTGATVSPVLRAGSANTAAVKLLQQLLGAKGFTVGAVDGVFGSKTRAAVVALQEQNDLDADGVVGVNTWRALRA